MKQKPISRSNNIILQEIADEVLIYDLEVNKAFCLNETSAMIWQECNGKQSVTEISQKLSRKLKTNISKEIVWLAISQFKTDGLLKNDDEIGTPFDGLTRREVVKKIGFASMIALPTIASVVAPNAVQAQSAVCSCASTTANSRPPGCSCSLDTQCCSGVCFLNATCQDLPVVGAACCPAAGNCGVFPLAPGCLCLNNGDCLSGNCVSSACQI